ncbi:hypothetical protein L1987_45352 [Smallanthus sonchifolius]|uniref:Uncharacterized protein n=1 Tax=Smallanthus sonchifolius TaxID=185202 RepID=A0ACB9GS06_9ASTR|nr:hypothetical protein L1987_45352 [Smallanthus sonchifolius]
MNCFSFNIKCQPSVSFHPHTITPRGMSPPKHHLSATGTAKPPEHKSKFLQTCNRLSLYLKEKGNIRDLNFAKFDATGVSATSPARATTVDLLSNIDDPVPGEKSASVLPQYVILESFCEAGDSAVAKPKTAQMTIFYQGQVLVLDDVPADRARDLMLMANNGVDLASTSKAAIKAEVQGKDSDLPIARRASLHKFLAKRKDRATVNQPQNQSPGGSSFASGNERSFDLNM